jgi:molecular chaperone GrpE
MADENQTVDNLDDTPPAEEAAEALQPALAAAEAKAAEYLEGWQRARAEFANYKRRVEKEQSETQQNATARVVGRFLEVLDDFERAMQDRPAAEADPEVVARWATGVTLIQRKLQNLLDAENVERIPAEGAVFDPNLHEAVTHEQSDGHEPGQVIGVIRHGYRIGDRVIRPSLVRVAR